MAAVTALLAAACTSSEPGAPSSEAGSGEGSGARTTTRPLPPGIERLVVAWSPWIGRGGNRVAEGVGALDRATPIDVALPGVPVRILPASGWADGPGMSLPSSESSESEPVEPPDPAPRWYVELESGEGVVIDENLTVVRRVMADPHPRTEFFDDPLPDGVPVQLGGAEVALVGPTDRYPHGVLGDRVEASAVEVFWTEDVPPVRFGPEPPSVIEGLSALLADATGDGRPEVLVTQSNGEVGAWLALWDPSGELVAESDPIGRGNRWRHQLAVAPVGPAGEIEIVEVRTPHLGATVQWHRVVGDRIELVAAQPGFTSHRLGSRNLDEALVADADGDGMLDVVLPTDDRTALGILTRTTGGVEVRAEVPLPGRMSSNLAVVADGPRLSFAAGTDDAVVRIWPAPTG